ncbi:MAG TPA: DUF3892 domain-containing protein [Chitinophagaceae bacterium]|nr:DUF3892 domain-containing protein [Chitinophagaceae bacterium]
MARLYVTGVWKNAQGVITHVMTNTPVTSGVLRPNSKLSVQQAVQFISVTGNEMFTAEWNYHSGTWKQGQKIVIVHEHHNYIRTTADNTVNDNLDNLLPMEQLIG